MKNIIPFVLIVCSTIFSIKAQNILIKNVNIINVLDGDISKNHNILIQDEKIRKISPSSISISEGTEIIDGTNKFVMPGMIDTHIHFFQTGSLYTRPDAIDLKHIVSYDEEIDFALNLVEDSFKRYLRLGITSVMDVGGPFSNFKVRDSIAKSTLSPNVFVTGPLFSPYQPEAFSKLDDIPIEKITSIEEASALFNKMLSFKPDFIKIWYVTNKNLPAEETYPIVEHIAKLTHENNLKLAVHATDIKTAKLAIKAGADILVHSVRDKVIDKDFIQLMKNKNVTYIPTLIVSENYGKAFLGKPTNHPQDLYFANPKVYGTLFDTNRLPDKEAPNTIKWLRNNEASYFKRIAKQDSISLLNLKKLLSNNLNIATGTDAGNIGTLHASSYIQEIEAMKKSGISYIDIIKACTINAAKGFGLDKNIGSVEEGKLADLIILNANPIEKLSNLNKIYEVIKSGKAVNIKKILEESPEQLVQRQVNAYNARNIDAFTDTYADDVRIYNFPETLSIEGKDQLKERFESIFKNVPNLYCEIKNRIVLGNKIVDREHVRFNNKYSDVIAIYEVTNGKISKVTFIR